MKVKKTARNCWCVNWSNVVNTINRCLLMRTLPIPGAHVSSELTTVLRLSWMEYRTKAKKKSLSSTARVRFSWDSDGRKVNFKTMASSVFIAFLFRKAVGAKFGKKDSFAKLHTTSLSINLWSWFSTVLIFFPFAWPSEGNFWEKNHNYFICQLFNKMLHLWTYFCYKSSSYQVELDILFVKLHII